MTPSLGLVDLDENHIKTPIDSRHEPHHSAMRSYAHAVGVSPRSCLGRQNVAVLGRERSPGGHAGRARTHAPPPAVGTEQGPGGAFRFFRSPHHDGAGSLSRW